MFADFAIDIDMTKLKKNFLKQLFAGTILGIAIAGGVLVGRDFLEVFFDVVCLAETSVATGCCDVFSPAAAARPSRQIREASGSFFSW